MIARLKISILSLDLKSLAL